MDFYAEWCPPCRIITPVFEELSVEFEDMIFLKVDVDGVPVSASTRANPGIPVV